MMRLSKSQEEDIAHTVTQHPKWSTGCRDSSMFQDVHPTPPGGVCNTIGWLAPLPGWVGPFTDDGLVRLDR